MILCILTKNYLFTQNQYIYWYKQEFHVVQLWVNGMFCRNLNFYMIFMKYSSWALYHFKDVPQTNLVSWNMSPYIQPFCLLNSFLKHETLWRIYKIIWNELTFRISLILYYFADISLTIQYYTKLSYYMKNYVKIPHRIHVGIIICYLSVLIWFKHFCFFFFLSFANRYSVHLPNVMSKIFDVKSIWFSNWNRKSIK